MKTYIIDEDDYHVSTLKEALDQYAYQHNYKNFDHLVNEKYFRYRGALNDVTIIEIDKHGEEVWYRFFNYFDNRSRGLWKEWRKLF